MRVTILARFAVVAADGVTSVGVLELLCCCSMVAAALVLLLMA